ncbi:TolC family protein [Sedimenticola hydrogenitrophicus]|uniref:TolC family protein n=1 Tax=Sedimenticola hydrogenitrophicus TaxID=2967975 RepID=UPI0023B1E6CF|nr:TolC family protein [Sedimenticola hydrogenitrophicus]
MRVLTHALIIVLGATMPWMTINAETAGLTLDKAIRIAVTTDPWLTGSRHQETALADEAVSAATLPDPRVSVMAANLPTDSFDLGQEAMTQLTVGVTQMFPRGDSRALARQQKQQSSLQQPLLRMDREAKVAATVSQLWLEAFKAEESIRLIENDRALFEQLVDAAEASYATALGRSRQQDVIRAQLELTRLDDRLTALNQQKESAQQQLSEWVGEFADSTPAGPLPMLELPAPALLTDNRPLSQPLSQQPWYEWLRLHPAVQAEDRRIDSMATGVELARQKYKPEWGVTAQYGYRADDPLGRERANLFSVGVSFDLPLFTSNRQDRDVSAAVARAEAVKTDKLLLVRQLMAKLEMARAQLKRLDQRQTLYQRQLLPQMSEQAEAALGAYNNDDGDFAEAVRSRIAELNAKIDALAIAVDRQKTIAQIRYLLAQVPTVNG